MLKKLSLTALCLGLLALANTPLAPTAYTQEPTNEELPGSSVGGLNLAQARAEYEMWRNRGGWYDNINLLRPLAEQGYGPAQYRMGYAYENGLGGLAKNYAVADEWWRKAAQTLPQQAEAGDDWAQYRLGELYYFGRGDLAENTATACSWWRKAAAQGNDDAQLDMGNAC